jgi:hypothetical protein
MDTLKTKTKLLHHTQRGGVTLNENSVVTRKDAMTWGQQQGESKEKSKESKAQWVNTTKLAPSPRSNGNSKEWPEPLGVNEIKQRGNKSFFNMVNSHDPAPSATCAKEISIPHSNCSSLIPDDDAAFDASSNLDSSEDSWESGDEGLELLSPQEQKFALVNRLMGFFYAVFEQQKVFKEHSPGSSSHEHTYYLSKTTTSGATVHDRKRSHAYDPDKKRESDEGDDRKKMPKRQRTDKSTGSSLRINRKVACPYYKRSPQKYHSVRSCPGPGWETVHRMK